MFACGTGVASGQNIHGVIPASIEKISSTDLEAYITQSDHPLIISFWATYCTPCIKEIPYIQFTVDSFKNQKVELLLVSLDRRAYYPAEIAAFARKSGYTARILWLDETDPGYFCPKVDSRWTGGIPSSLFINNGTHYRRFFDRQLTEAQVGLEIKKMLAPQRSPAMNFR